MLFIFLCLTSLSLIISRSIHVAADGIISFSCYVSVCACVHACVYFVYLLFKAASPLNLQFSSVQSLSSVQFSHVRLFSAQWTAACQASLSIANSRSLLKLMSIESVMPSNHFILCCPLLLPPSIFPSIKVFSNDSVLHIRLESQLQHQSFQ